MTSSAVTIEAVLQEVQGRVPYLRALPPSARQQGSARQQQGSQGPSAEGGAGNPTWRDCDDIGEEDLRNAIEAGATARASSRQVAASLLSQSYAFKVGATSLAAYALGLPWPTPSARATAVVFAGGRASQLAFRDAALGDAEDVDGLGTALLDAHLVPWSARLRATVRLGERLVAGNVAASSAAAFRAMEGAARDRGAEAERAAIRRRASAFFATASVQRRLRGAGRWDVVRLEQAGVDGWFWTRTSCCLWYQAPGVGADGGPHTCDDCSLIPAHELERRRRDELTTSANAARNPAS